MIQSQAVEQYGRTIKQPAQRAYNGRIKGRREYYDLYLSQSGHML